MAKINGYIHVYSGIPKKYEVSVILQKLLKIQQQQI